MWRLKLASLGILVLMLGAVLTPAVSQAFTVKSGNDVTNVAKSATTQGTLYASGRTVIIDGDINGDLICAGSTVTVNGAVKGDIICAAQSITINGPVDGNIRLAAQTVTLSSTVTRNASVAAQTFTMLSSAKVDGDVSLLAQTASIYGPVGRDLYGALATLSLSSTVGNNLDATVTDLTLGSAALVTGNLTYTSNSQLAIDKSKVTGTVTFHEATKSQRSQGVSINPVAWFFGWIYFMVAILILGFFLVWLAPRPLRGVTQTMLDQPGTSVGIGLLLLFVGPFVLIAFLLTLVAIPLALFLGSLWIAALALANLLAGVAVGRWMTNRFKWNKDSLAWATLTGIPLVLLVAAIPFIGFFVELVIVWWVLGGVFLSTKALRD